LIQAFCSIALEFPEANLYLVGDEADREKFQAQINRLKIRHLLRDRSLLETKKKKSKKTYLGCTAIALIMRR
jgi:hypothetical protein